jgi:hypothetical protein
MKIIILLCLGALALSSCYAVGYYPDYYYDDYPHRAVYYYGPTWDEFIDLAILGTLIWDVGRTDHYSVPHHYGGYRYRR